MKYYFFVLFCCKTQYYSAILLKFYANSFFFMENTVELPKESIEKIKDIFNKNDKSKGIDGKNNSRSILISILDKIEVEKQTLRTEVYDYLNKLTIEDKGKLKISKSSGSTLRRIIEAKEWEERDIKDGKGRYGYKMSCSVEKMISFHRIFYMKYSCYWNFEKSEAVCGKLDGQYYNIFYWRTDGRSVETLGIGKIRISYDWKDADLTLFYTSKSPPDASFKGIVERKQNHIYFELKDIHQDKNFRSNVYIVLHDSKSEQSLVENIFLGGILSNNRIKNHTILSSVLFLKSNSVDISSNDYLESFINENRRGFIWEKRELSFIKYFLIGRSIKDDKNVNILQNIFDLHGINDYNVLEDYIGIYQSIDFLTTESTNKINSVIVGILHGGETILKITNNQNNEEDVISERGIAKVIYNKNKKIIALFFNFIEESRTYRSQLILEKEEGSSDLKGVYSGLIDNNIASGRVYLKKIDDLKLSETTSYKEQILKTLDEHKNVIKVIPLTKKINPREQLLELAENNIEIFDFFTDNYFDKHTDKGLDLIFNEKNKEEIPISNAEKPQKTLIFKDLSGMYKCYFSSINPPENGHDKDSSTFGLKLRIVPLKIKDNRISINYSDSILEANYIFYDRKKVLLIFNTDFYYITITFKVGVGKTRFYGVFTVNSDNYLGNDANIESSYLIIETANLQKFNFEEDAKDLSDLKQLVEEERQLKQPIITKVFGMFNRVIFNREPNNSVSYLRQSAYRRIFWDSAKFNAMMCNNAKTEKEKTLFLNNGIDDLRKAFRHGFAMKYFGKKSITENIETTENHFEYNNDNGYYPKVLKSEYNEVEKEFTNPEFFKDQRFKDILKKNWIDFNIPKP